MNVGSILNDDNPSDVESKASSPVKPPIRGRNSIVSLLNDEKTPSPEKEEQGSTLKQEIVPDSEFKSQAVKEEKAKGTEAEEPKKVDDKPVSENKFLGPNDGTINSKNKDVQKDEEDEIARLNRLKYGNKPKRYEVPPIWAHEWIPKSNGKVGKIHEEYKEPSKISEKSIFNSYSTTSVDLECSVTGIIPPPSVTRRIAEWIYANFVEITETNRKYVELELKFGTIMDKVSNNRINILVSTECIYTDTSNIYFEPGIHQVGFEDMLEFFEELEKSYQEELKNQPIGSNKPRRKFNILETDMTDSIYYVRNRNEQPKSIRISKDNLLNPPRYTGINKHRISDLYIHNPSSMYDLRLSLSLENPVANDEIEAVMKKSKPSKVRIKQRNSFKHKPTVTQFDLTRVTTPKELKNTSTGKRIVENEKSYEVELEIDTAELFNGFDMFKNGTNSIRFEELVEIFLNNARCLNNRVTKLAK